MKLKVKASERKYFTGQGIIGECKCNIQATKVGGKLASVLIYISGKDAGDASDVEVRYDSHYGSQELEPRISFASSSDKGIARAQAVYNALAVAIDIVNSKGLTWVEQNIKPE